MQSQKPVEPLDTLEQDVPTTAEDTAALERIRELNAMDPHEYLAFLVAFSKHHPPGRETGSDDDLPFTLP
jgi:hypothetical protein